MTNLTPHIASAPTGDVPLGRKDTIAAVVIDGQRYEIDWPRDDEDPDQRNPFLAAIYFPDGELMDYIEPGEPGEFLRETDVITAAMEWFTHACLLASGLLLPAEADQPIRAVQVRPHHRVSMKSGLEGRNNLAIEWVHHHPGITVAEVAALIEAGEIDPR